MKSPNIRSRSLTIGVLGIVMLMLAIGMLFAIRPAMGAPEDPWILYSYEDNTTQSWAPDGSVGSVATSTDHATDGMYSLQITSTGGHFEGRPSGTAVDWRGWDSLVLDIYSPISTTTHVAFKTGSSWTWQQTPDYQLITGTNTITVTLSVDITLNNPEDVRSLLVYYPAANVYYQDNIRLVGYTPPPPTLTPTSTATLGPTPTSLANLPGLRVMGRDVYDHCGEKILLRGVNKMVTWTDRDGDSFPEIAKTGANSVRIVWLPTDDPAQLDIILQRAIDNGLIPMVGMWNTTGNWDELTIALEYWLRPDVISVVQKYEQYMLLNVGNEAGDGSITAEQFKETYRYIILRLRGAGIHTPIVIDASGWGQSIDVLQAAGPYLQSMDPDHNLIFDVHTYWPYKWGWSDARVESEFAEFAALNLPLVIGEFGNKWDNDGSAGDEIPYRLIIRLAYEYGFGYYPWEWGPGNNPQTHLNMTHDSTYDTLHDWGLEVAITSTYSILNTSGRPYSLLNGGACQSGATATPGPSPEPYNNQPVVAIVAPEFNAMLAAPAEAVIEAEASDLDGTISKVAFYANGRWIGEDTAAPYTTTFETAIVGEYWLTARAVDDAGGVALSKGQYVIVGTPAHFSINNTITTNISDTLSDLHKFYYDGDWNLGLSPNVGRFHDDDQYSFTTGDTFEISFHGTQIGLYSSLAAHHGIADILIDSEVYTADLYSPTNVSDALVWMSEELPLGDHTLVVTVTGKHNPAATGSTVTVDRVRITTGETVEYREVAMPLVQRDAAVTPPATPTAKPPTPTMQPTNTLIIPTRTPWPTSTPTLTPTPTSTPSVCVPGTDVVVYHDSTTWDNWSWGSTVADFNNTSVVYDGSAAISVTIGADWDGFSLHHATAITNTDNLVAISFYVNGGPLGGQDLQFYIEGSGGESAPVPFTVISNTWTLVNIPLGALGDPADITRLTIQNRNNGTENTFYLDEITVRGRDCGTPTPTPVAYFYSDGPVDSWSWGGIYTATHTSTVHSGENAIAVDITAADGALRLHRSAALSTTGFDRLTFYVHANGNAHQLYVYLNDLATKYSLDVASGTEWARVEVLLSDLGSPASITDVQIQDRSGAAQPVFYVDDIVLEGPGDRQAFIYTDSLLDSGWSWGGTYDWHNTTTVHSGTEAISVTYTASFGGLIVRRRQGPVDTTGYDRIAFYINPNGNSYHLLIQTRNEAGTNSTQTTVDVAAGTDWVLVEIPLSELGNPADIMHITIQEGSDSAQPVFYIDDIMLLGN
ncbi:MAG: cellulase family glycosylhydrolase [Chloroflexota bacterium]